MLPLTEHSIAAVAAMMKRGKYRAFPNYLSIAKAMHITDGYQWSLRLALGSMFAGIWFIEAQTLARALEDAGDS